MMRACVCLSGARACVCGTCVCGVCCTCMCGVYVYVYVGARVVYVYVYVGACTCMWVHVWCMCTCMWVHVWCMCTCMCTCMWVHVWCMCICMWVHLYSNCSERAQKCYCGSANCRNYLGGTKQAPSKLSRDSLVSGIREGRRKGRQSSVQNPEDAEVRVQVLLLRACVTSMPPSHDLHHVAYSGCVTGCIYMYWW